MGFAMSTFSMVSGFWGPWNTAAFMDSSFLGQEVTDENAGSRCGQGLDEGLAAQDLLRSVAPAERRRRVRDRPSVDFQDAIDQVHDPVVLQTSASVEAALALPVEGEARLRDLDDERGPRGMLTAVAPTSAARDRDVGLWLGLVVELDGALGPHQPARLQRSVRAGDVVMQGALRHTAGDVNVSDAGRWSTRGRSRAALGLTVDGAPGRRPAAEAALEMGHARKPHLAQHVRGERRTLAAGTVHDDAFHGIDLARVVVRRRVEPELEHATRHVGRAGNEAELAPLADVADVQDLDVTARHLGLDLLDRQVLNPRLRFLDHLPDGLPRLPHICLLSTASSHRRRDRAPRWTPRSARCPGARVTPPRFGSPTRRACSPSSRVRLAIRRRGR